MSKLRIRYSDSEDSDRCFCTYCGNQILTEAAVNFARVHVEGTVQTRTVDFDIRAGILVSYNGSSSDVEVPEGVIQIDDNAFALEADARLQSLPIRKLTLPQSVERFSPNSIMSILELEEVATHSDGPYLTSIDGVLYVPPLSALAVYPPNRLDAEYQVAPGTKSVNISNARYLRKLSLPDSVESLHLSNLRTLNAINLPDSLTTIELYLCSGDAISNLSIPSGVERLSVRSCNSIRIYLQDGMSGSLDFEGSSDVTIRYPSSYLARNYPRLAADGKGVELYYRRYSSDHRSSEELRNMENVLAKQEQSKAWTREGLCPECGSVLSGVFQKKCPIHGKID